MKKSSFAYIVVGIQLLILIGMFVKAYYPIYFGKELILKTESRDPRDIFRGNYCDLSYAFNNLSLENIPNDLPKKSEALSNGDAVYVEYAQKGDSAVIKGVWMQPKDAQEGVFYLKCIVDYYYYYEGGSGSLTVHAGIESYFADIERTKQIDEASMSFNRDSLAVYVHVMVAPNGVSRIKELEIKNLK